MSMCVYVCVGMCVLQCVGFSAGRLVCVHVCVCAIYGCILNDVNVRVSV